MSQLKLEVFIDFKSPYAFLAVKPLRAIAVECDVVLDWLPYNLTISEFLGSVDDRNEHQWRRVKYSYMDARRLANQRNMTILGPRKIFDSTFSSIALLFAKKIEKADLFIDLTFERFFKRELDIENTNSLGALLEECGGTTRDFIEYLKGEGRVEFENLMQTSYVRGVFGVPSFIFEEELFWGNERLELLKERFRAKRLKDTKSQNHLQ